MQLMTGMESFPPNMSSPDPKFRQILQASHGGMVGAAEAMRQAVAFFQGGNFAEVERLCRLVLKTKSNQFDALHLLGLVRHSGAGFGKANRYWRGRPRIIRDRPKRTQITAM